MGVPKIQFSLRSLLFVLVAIALVIAILMLVTDDYRARLAIQSELVSQGATFARVDSNGQILSMATLAAGRRYAE